MVWTLLGKAPKFYVCPLLASKNSTASITSHLKYRSVIFVSPVPISSLMSRGIHMCVNVLIVILQRRSESTSLASNLKASAFWARKSFFHFLSNCRTFNPPGAHMYSWSSLIHLDSYEAISLFKEIVICFFIAFSYRHCCARKYPKFDYIRFFNLKATRMKKHMKSKAIVFVLLSRHFKENFCALLIA